MKIKYDPDADALYIKFRDGDVSETKKIDDNTMIDFDADGKVRGVELLFVKENNLLDDFEVENIVTV